LSCDLRYRAFSPHRDKFFADRSFELASAPQLLVAHVLEVRLGDRDEGGLKLARFGQPGTLFLDAWVFALAEQSVPVAGLKNTGLNSGQSADIAGQELH
jgi:hypothetical protein